MDNEEKGPFLYNPAMALVVFLRGVNVGGHRTFRPSILARELNDYGVVNVGAADTFVVRKPGPRAKFHAELLRKLRQESSVLSRPMQPELFAGAEGSMRFPRHKNELSQRCPALVRRP